MRILLALLVLTACDDTPSPPPQGAPHDWRDDVIYFAMTDRFANGDLSNDTLGEPNCFDPTDPKLFHGGDFFGLSQNTPYFTELGITALWISPVTQQVDRVGDACGYHGYWPDYQKPDRGLLEWRFGEPFELDDAMQAAPRVLLDIVLNHAGYGAKIAETNPNYFHTQTECDNALDPQLTCPLALLPDFAQEKPQVANYLTDLARAWFADFGFSGIRVDAAKHMPLPFLRDNIIPAIRNEDPNAFLLAEVLGDEDYNALERYLAAGFTSVFNVPLRYALVDALARGESTDVIATRMTEAVGALGQTRTMFLTTFLGNHDIPRFASEISTDLPVAEREQRYTLGLVALFTLPGIPQLTWGDELGREGFDEAERRRDMPAWAFVPSQRTGSKAGFVADVSKTFDLTQRLIALRTANDTLKKGIYTELWRPNGSADVFVFARSLGSTLTVVAINNDSLEQTLAVPIANNNELPVNAKRSTATLHDGVKRGAPPSATIANGVLDLTLPGKTAAVYLE